MSRVKRKKVLDQHQSPPEQTSAGMTGRAIRVCSQMFSACAELVDFSRAVMEDER